MNFISCINLPGKTKMRRSVSLELFFEEVACLCSFLRVFEHSPFDLLIPISAQSLTCRC